MDQEIPTLLAADEPPAVMVARAEGGGDYFITCEHSGRAIPRRLGDLGVAPADLTRHIAWDIGVAGVGRALSAALDATLVTQTYSRLVIDCNRTPETPQSILSLSEETEIPGNRDVTAAEVAARAREVFHPYHDRIAALLDRRAAAGRASILVALHSYTPVYHGETRPWHIGILYNRDDRLARVLLDLLAGETDLIVGDNKPYFVDDSTDYTIPVHGERRGIPHVEIEIRQDLIADAAGQADWAARLTRLFQAARDQLAAASVI